MPEIASSNFEAGRPWDARLARRLVTPLLHSRVTPNHLTTLRLGVGLAAALCFLPGSFKLSNVAALLMVLSNFLDHTDGELARLSGKTSRFGHLYDLASDAVVTIMLFVAIGFGVRASRSSSLDFPLIGTIAGVAIASIFYIRMRIENLAGKAGTRQASLGGFETEDLLYLLPAATVCNALPQMLIAASLCAPLYGCWAAYEYRRVVRRLQVASADGMAR